MSRRAEALWVAALAAATIAVYAQVVGHSFTNYDDPLYIMDNPHVRTGLSLENAVWAFRSGEVANWHPITWLSHQLDCTLYGLNAGMHLLTNLMLHLASTLLLYLFLRKATGRIGPSLLVAALFALHPLHVESVAWVAERKDVLSTFFAMLALLAYLRFVRRRTFGAYALTAVFFALGLMAKPMLVTLPCVLLLLDYWPLGRFEGASGFVRRGAWLIFEKIPLFALTIASSIITYMVQNHGGAVRSLENLPLDERFFKIVLAYFLYVKLMFIPRGLTIMHPIYAVYAPSIASIAAILLGMAGVTAACWMARRRAPWGIVGWFWYLGTLAPVIGIVQVGDQIISERYTYIPLIGLFIALAWSFDALPRRLRMPRALPWAISLFILAILAGLTCRQVGFWKDRIAMFERAVAVTEENPSAHKSLASGLEDAGRIDEALRHLVRVTELAPNKWEGFYDVGTVLLKHGAPTDAVSWLEQAILLGPTESQPHINLSLAYFRTGRMEEAAAAARKAHALDPDSAEALTCLGTALAAQGRISEAFPYFQQASALAPDTPGGWLNLGVALRAMGRHQEALEYLDRYLAQEPNSVSALVNSAMALQALGQQEEALARYQAALRLDPKNTDAQNGVKAISASF